MDYQPQISLSVVQRVEGVAQYLYDSAAQINTQMERSGTDGVSLLFSSFQTQFPLLLQFPVITSL